MSLKGSFRSHLYLRTRVAIGPPQSLIQSAATINYAVNTSSRPHMGFLFRTALGRHLVRPTSGCGIPDFGDASFD
ncbi:hypothetical protein A0H81_08562 [Grifola frondosa]|uniref:Uncharacterized protein n=1 Tax=Grifola frondosa TaxID=5627 RepID=A0A1C7M3R0_GRIFR|nr:hypothetical protein A0H81_08562 [Grifola frondosa]